MRSHTVARDVIRAWGNGRRILGFLRRSRVILRTVT